MAKRRTCTTCGGSGRVTDFFAILFTFANWIPFNHGPVPYKRCPGCDGRGYGYEEWKTYSPTWRRRGR